MKLAQVHHERFARLAARKELWALGAVIVAFAGWWATGSVIVPIAVAALAFVWWRRSRDIANLRTDLALARRERAAMEEALRQSQKMEAIGRLTAGIAHDFNNHLTVISSNVELLKRRLDGNQERLIRHIDAAMQGVQRAAVLTGRLLSFSRPPTAEPEAVDVGRLLTGLSELLRRTLGEGVRLDVQILDERWFVWADVNRMENALLSLAVNARDKVSSGGILTLAASNVRLDDAFVATHPGVLPGDYVRIAVGDATIALSGANPPPEWQPADDLADAGLSMARGFVRESGGCLLRSGPVTGPPSLRLFLPRYQPPSPAGAVTRHRSDGRPAILVVEDEAAVRRACVETLRELDYEVLEAPDAMEAFRLIADRGGIDLLFTDLGLPGGVSGRALADAARNVDPGIRVLFSTGYAQTDSQERSDIVLLPKPFNPAQLAEKIRLVLEGPVPADRTETVRS